MLIPNSTTGTCISHYMGNKSRYAIKQSCSIRMESSVLRRQALWDICKDIARRREAVHSEGKNYSLLKRHHCTKLQHECITHWLPSCPRNEFFIDRCGSIQLFLGAVELKQQTGTSQAAPQLTDSFKRIILLWNGRLKGLHCGSPYCIIHLLSLVLSKEHSFSEKALKASIAYDLNVASFHLHQLIPPFSSKPQVSLCCIITFVFGVIICVNPSIQEQSVCMTRNMKTWFQMFQPWIHIYKDL